MRAALFASSIALALTSGSSFAADFSPYKAPPPAPVSTWTGCYVGAGVGYGMSNQDNHDETYPGLVASENVDQTAGGRGWLGRFGGGCDYQVGSSIVIGALADYDWSNIHGGFQDLLTGLVGDENLSHSWAAGGRIGYLPYPNLLAFMSVGYTQAHYDAVTLSTVTAPITPAFDFGAHTYNGWFLGGGYEYKLAFLSGLSWKTEYRFSEFQSADLPILTLPGGGATGFAEHMSNYVQTVTTGLVWRFDFGGIPSCCTR
jgi:outer membrane immunogenic protein